MLWYPHPRTLITYNLKSTLRLFILCGNELHKFSVASDSLGRFFWNFSCTLYKLLLIKRIFFSFTETKLRRLIPLTIIREAKCVTINRMKWKRAAIFRITCQKIDQLSKEERANNEILAATCHRAFCFTRFKGGQLLIFFFYAEV